MERVDPKHSKIAVIGDSLLVSGMSSAGIKVLYNPSNTQEIERAISEVLSNDNIGIVIISEELASKITDRKILRAMDGGLLPLFVRIEGRGAKAGEDMLRKLILRAIGIDIGLSK